MRTKVFCGILLFGITAGTPVLSQNLTMTRVVDCAAELHHWAGLLNALRDQGSNIPFEQVERAAETAREMDQALVDDFSLSTSEVNNAVETAIDGKFNETSRRIENGEAQEAVDLRRQRAAECYRVWSD